MEEKKLLADNEISLLDYMIVFLKRKKMILSVTFSIAVLTVIISLILPVYYRSDARILPPQQSSVSASLLSQFAGGLGSLAGGIIGGTSSDLYVGMLQSRTVLDAVIDQFDLMHLYNKDYKVDTRAKLLDNIVVASDIKSGIITVSVLDQDPKRAADMANAFISELKKLAQGLAVTDASKRRLYYQEQMKTATQALAKSEEELKTFAEKTGALPPDAQVTAIITGLAQMKAAITAKEVEIKVMRTYALPQNPDLQKAEAGLKGMKTELQKMEAGANGYDPLMPTGSLPSVGMEYVRKMRDLKVNEALLDLFRKQYELARLDESKDAALIQVVDRAIPMDYKDKPKRALICVVGTFAGFFLAVFAAFFLEHRENMDKEKRELMTKYSDLQLKNRFKKIKNFLLRRK